MNASRKTITNEIASDHLVPVDAILGTEELQRRPRRTSDLEAENRAYAELAQHLADSPSTVLQKTCETLLKLLHADSAGFSLRTRDGDQLHWAAVAGAWSSYAGSGTPHDFSPCGEAIERQAPLLFLQPQRRYEYLARLSPPSVEWLIAPFEIRGRTVGAIWVVAHDEHRRFDAEDLRQLESLSRFASAAYQGSEELELSKNSRRAALNLMEDARQAHQAMERLNAEMRMREAQSAADSTALSKLNELSSRLWRMRNVGEGLDEMLGATIEMLGADFGNIQLLEGGPVLVITAQRGFRRDFLDYFRQVTAEDDSACGRTLRSGQRTIIGDVESDPAYAPHRAIARSAGYRAVTSTAMIGRDGSPLGIISTYFRHPHIPSDQDLRRLDLYVRQAADFLEHKRAESALRTSEVRYRRLFESAKDGILVLDTHTARITDANPYVCELLGYTHLEVRDKELWEVGLFEDAEACRAAVLELQRKQYLRFEELGVRTRTGQQIDVEFVSNVYREGDISVVQCNIRDITERKRLEHELRRYAADLSEADRRKNEFLAMLAHELRNPLAPIRNAARAMRLTGSGDEALVSASEMLERQVGQMVRLVDDLVDVSRISRGKIELRKHRVEMGAMVRQAAEAVRTQIQTMHHDLKLTLPREPIFVNADATRLLQVVGNLLTNASKFTDRGGRIEVRLEREGEQAVLRVRDNGIGIATDQIPHIFEMFMQVDVSLERSTTGLGIGLTLVKSLIEMHGGTVEVESDGPGMGTEFRVRLPILADDAAPGSEESHEARPHNGKALRILVVDDNRDSATSLAMLLQMSGNKTHVVHDGLEAVEAVKKFKPDVTLLDIGLPKLNGYEVAKRIRKQLKGKEMLLIAVTGWGQEEDRQKSREAGFDGHLVKPVDYDTLLGLLTTKVSG